MQKTTVKKQQVTPFLEVQECLETGYKSIYATRDLKPFSTLIKFESQKVLTAPSQFTVQVSETQHVQLKPDYLQYMNHSCAPNIFFDTERMVLTTLKHIQSGEQIAFFYPSTEWKMTEPFDCNCGSDNCLQHIGGAAYLSYEDLSKYKLSDFVVQKYSGLAER